MKKTIREAAGGPAHPGDGKEMEQAVALWSSLYSGGAPWLGGQVQSLGLPAAIASELARMVTIEMESRITPGRGNPARAEFLNRQYQPVLDRLRGAVEFACAKGGLILKPFIDGGRIAVDLIQADCFHPIAFDGSGRGEITAAAFSERKTAGRRTFTRLEIHRMEEDGLHIRNEVYVSDKPAVLGVRTGLSQVEDWSDLPEEIHIAGVDRPLFAYFKMPFANQVDPHSSLGVSVFSRAVGLIEQADRQYSRILWEFEGSELAVDASVDLFRRDGGGRPVLPRGKERLFRTFDVDGFRDGAFLQAFSPAIRDQALFHGLNRLFQRIEFNCGLSYGTLSDPQNAELTATEIISSRQRMYSTVVDIQKSLQSALEQLIHAMDAWATIGGLAAFGGYETSFTWDDSIIVDSANEQVIRMREVEAGLVKPERYLMWRYGVGEKEARSMMQKEENDEHY